MSIKKTNEGAEARSTTNDISIRKAAKGTKEKNKEGT
jgi:hypothetical protein